MMASFGQFLVLSAATVFTLQLCFLIKMSQQPKDALCYNHVLYAPLELNHIFYFECDCHRSKSHLI